MKDSSMMRLEREKIKYQNQKKKYLDITEILREKSNDFQRIHRLNEETLTKTSFQHNEQFDILKVENAKQNFTLESEKKNAERMETEVKLYPATLAAAPHHCVESQTPERHLELAFQSARHGGFSSQEKKNFDIYNLKDSSDIPSQKNSKSEITNSDLENEIGQKKDTLRVRTLISEQEKSLLKQTKCQMKETECKCQNEQRKMSEYTSEQKSIKEILSKLQSKITLLQQLLHDLHKKEEKQNNVVINIQNQFHDIRERFQVQTERYNLLLKTRNIKLFNENNHLMEKCQHKSKNKKRNKYQASKLFQVSLKEYSK
ncbi:Ankyrin repeat domain-containing protein 26 [Sciurus carolinensis]|uniref:Ankyrin repeat domain-containing protein 26 n=1 Tax=Sciurus carolinensis TaxID=30640 RepID=A0AA41N3M6_SCICA|nr:Ankyrin repeat domain-containing protein 26 [Sciurus carolinensis]